MKKIIPLAVFAILLAACGDTIETESQTDIVATLEDLPKCTKDNESDQAFVKEDAVTRICVDGNWVPMSGSLSADFGCKAVITARLSWDNFSQFVGQNKENGFV